MPVSLKWMYTWMMRGIIHKRSVPISELVTESWDRKKYVRGSRGAHMTEFSTPSLSLCCSHTLGDTYRRSFCGGLLWLPLAPCLEIPLVIARITWVVLRRGARWGVAFSTEIFAVHVVDLTSFPFSLMFRWWQKEGRRIYLGVTSHQVAVATN
jgi:hypothetical protein